jgi:UDP-N-acetyl-D-mannosaminuronate dehydrogenase
MDLVIGMGELGRTIFDLLASKKINVVGFDSDRSKCTGNIPTDSVPILHICIPYSVNFTDSSLEYIKKFEPSHVIIHSTVQPNTTSAIQGSTPIKLVYSPSRGVHERFLQDMKRYTKYYSYYGSYDSLIFDIMRTRFNAIEYVDNPKTLEIAKILVDTTYYGLLIAWRKIVDEYCTEHNVSPDNVWAFAKEIHEFLGNRPVMYNDGKTIGGHCVLQNLDLLKGTKNIEIIKSLIGQFSDVGGNHE